MRNANGASVDYEYDNNNRLTKITAGSSVTVYGYNLASQVTSVSDGTTQATFSYDNRGNVASKSLSSGLIETYSYDDLDRLIEKTVMDENGVDKLHLTYQFDGLGNVIRRMKVQDGVLEIQEFEYDQNNFLVRASKSIDGASADVSTWKYDQAGNRIEESKNLMVQ